MVASDPVAAPLLELLAVFEGPLKDVRFPDVDRAVLVELADGVRASAEDVERAGAALLAAKAALDDRREALLRMSQRALAYARVYAEDDADLRAKLDSIAMPKMRASAKSAAPRAAEVASSPVNAASPADAEGAVAPQSADRQPGDMETPGTEVVGAPAPKRRGRPPRAKPEAMPAAPPSEPTSRDAASPTSGAIASSEPIAASDAEETLAAE